MPLFLYISRICGCSTPPDSFGPTAFRWCLCCTEQVKFKPDLRFSLPVSVRKTSPFCVRSLGVVLLLVQAHLWVSGRPPPLWRLTLAAGSLRTGQTVTAVAFPPETGRTVPKNFIISHLLHCSGVPNHTHTRRYFNLMPFLLSFILLITHYIVIKLFCKWDATILSFCEFKFHALL